jgi:hypothetical protein
VSALVNSAKNNTPEVWQTFVPEKPKPRILGLF